MWGHFDIKKNTSPHFCTPTMSQSWSQRIYALHGQPAIQLDGGLHIVQSLFLCLCAPFSGTLEFLHVATTGGIWAEPTSKQAHRPLPTTSSWIHGQPFSQAPLTPGDHLSLPGVLENGPMAISWSPDWFSWNNFSKNLRFPFFKKKILQQTTLFW